MCRYFMEKLEQTISQQPQENRQPLHSTTHKELKKHQACILLKSKSLLALDVLVSASFPAAVMSSSHI